MLARQGNRTLLGDHPVCSLALDDLPTPAVTPSVTEVLGFLLTVDSDEQIKLPKAQPGKSKGCQGIPKTLCVARNRHNCFRGFIARGDRLCESSKALYRCPGQALDMGMSRTGLMPL